MANDPGEELTNGESEGGEDTPEEPGSARPDDVDDIDDEDGGLAASLGDVPDVFPSGEVPVPPSAADAPAPFG
jgi:hypothetical protein